MSGKLTESVVEDAALEWFGTLGYTTIRGRVIAPGEPQLVIELKHSAKENATTDDAKKRLALIAQGSRFGCTIRAA